MNRTLRYLRIAFSATCLIACVLLIVLWVRSYFTLDYLGWNKTRYGWGVSIASTHGGCEMMFATYNEVWTDMSPGFTYITRPSPNWSEKTRFGFATNGTDEGNHFLTIPYWFIIAISIFLTAAPWIRWHFRLRTLLLVTTLVAVVLDFIVWATK